MAAAPALEAGMGDADRTLIGEIDGMRAIGALVALAEADRIATWVARVSPSADGPDAGRVELWIDGGDLPEGASQPFWLGSAEITRSDGAGQATFIDVGREGDPAPEPGSDAKDISADRWPASLSGTLSWSCQPW